ncbi:hypothetical protein RF11_01868 [Thelohanellus kitauei]|uniref:Uncharacterized protein n=1 Tax=Thelohanellus kitauei TaxID=669202 RepID=A0A0C2ICR4_THEKT|nr:hypothetical protein RF11_01868 [Thelohanellus kitauei]
MLIRLKLLEDIEFIVTKFFELSKVLVKRHIYMFKDTTFIVQLSKIWTGLLHKSRNKFQITNYVHLFYLSAIFSIDISRKLMAVCNGSDKFVVTQNMKDRLYIIYLSLIVFPVIRNKEKIWICDFLTELNVSFGKYLQKYSLKDHTIENQFLIIRYYIKSLVTLDIRNSWGEDEIITDFIERLPLYPAHSNLYY